MPLHLEIVTPERLAFEGDVDEVIVPGSEGALGILPHHAPLISLLGQGVLCLRCNGEEEEFAIDVARAERARREAEHVIEGGPLEPADLVAARAALERALIRLKVAGRGAPAPNREREGVRRRARSGPQEPPGA
jgi:F-type H+-transporting ATPase subunit epsilon